jgi:aspartate ammonia-lyase
MAARPSRTGPSRSRKKSRIERDSLGEIEVSADALYGIRTIRSMRNLSFSPRALGLCPQYVSALATVKKAAARANRIAGVIDSKIADAIEAACDAIVRSENHSDFPADVLSGGGGIAVNMNVNEVIANIANEALGGARGSYAPVDPIVHVNASQSTADVCHTAARIAIINRWRDLESVLGVCLSVTRSKAREFHAIETLARTCLQDASVTSLGEMFGGYAAGLGRRTTELDRGVRRLYKINLGATVLGDGSGAPKAYRRGVIKYLNELTELRLDLRNNLFDAAQNCDDLGAVAAQLGLLAEFLIKYAQDLRLLSSGPEGGFGEITLPAVMEGSSFYPGKINPVVPETMLQCCFQVLGCERAARLALEHGELNLNVFEGAAAINTMDAMEMLTRAVANFASSCIAKIAPNETRCAELASIGRKRTRKE